MSITLTLFLVVCSLFALRGAVLGFVAWLTRIMGLICGYILAWGYRDDLAKIVVIYARDWPVMLLQVLCGITLFFAGTILTNMFISALLDILRKTNKALNTRLKYKSTQGRILGAGCNTVLGGFMVLIGIWGYGQAQNFQLVPALPANNQAMQSIANKVGQASFGFLLEAIVRPSPAIAPPTIDLEVLEELAVAAIASQGQNTASSASNASVSLSELRSRMANTQQQQENSQTATSEEGTASITLTIEDVQGHATDNVDDDGTNSVALTQILGNDANSQSRIADQVNSILQDDKLLTSTLSQYMSPEQAKTAGKQLQQMMQDPQMQKVMQDNIKQLMNNPAAIQQILQSRHNSGN